MFSNSGETFGGGSLANLRRPFLDPGSPTSAIAKVVNNHMSACGMKSENQHSSKKHVDLDNKAGNTTKTAWRLEFTDFPKGT